MHYVNIIIFLQQQAVPMLKAGANKILSKHGFMVGALTTQPMPNSVELHCMKHAKKPVVVDVVSVSYRGENLPTLRPCYCHVNYYAFLLFSSFDRYFLIFLYFRTPKKMLTADVRELAFIIFQKIPHKQMTKFLSKFKSLT